MISKIRYEDGREYECDECKIVKGRFKNYGAALAAGWALAYARKFCYCPACAPNHRNVGCKGSKTNLSNQWLPDGFEQLSILK